MENVLEAGFDAQECEHSFGVNSVRFWKEIFKFLQF